MNNRHAGGVALLISLLISQTALAESSFNEVRERVYRNPQTTLPQYPDISLSQLLYNVALRSGELTQRAKATFRDESDFKPAAPKLLHPRGVVADAVWKIDRTSEFTGLFAKGTEIRAIVRMSSGTQQSEFKEGSNRILGIAIKLFPSQNPDEKVITQNILTLDNTGLDGSDRKRFLVPEADHELYFSNIAVGESAIAKFGNWFFSRFDRRPTVRALYPLAEIDQNGKPVSASQAPKEIRFVPRILRRGGPVPSTPDFRSELLAYRAGEITFDIVVPGNVTVGSLVLGEPVVTEAGDLELHFHHVKTRKKE